jgi:hypothetical protein
VVPYTYCTPHTLLRLTAEAQQQQQQEEGGGTPAVPPGAVPPEFLAKAREYEIAISKLKKELAEARASTSSTDTTTAAAGADSSGSGSGSGYTKGAGWAVVKLLYALLGLSGAAALCFLLAVSDTLAPRSVDPFRLAH